MRAEYLQKLGSPPPTNWRNLSDLDQIVTAMLAAGRAESAAVLARAGLSAGTSTLGRRRPDRDLAAAPRRAGPGTCALAESGRGSRAGRPRTRGSATTYLVEDDFEAARRHYRQALEAKPDLFEAHYCLAVLEQDAGDAAAAYDLAQKAIDVGAGRGSPVRGPD